MERKNGQIENLSENEYAIMDEIYFPTSFDAIVKNTKLSREDVSSLLKNLLQKEFVHQMKFNETMNDYERCLDADYSHPETYLYVASKKGLLAHNM